MSATNRNGLARHARDFYETPAHAIDLVLDALGITPDFRGYLIDPGSGTGHIAHRVALRCPNADIRGIELDGESVNRARASRSRTIAFECADWLTWQSDGAPDFVVGNPPYQATHIDLEKVNTCSRCKGKGVLRPRGEPEKVCPNCFGVELPHGGLVIDDAELAEKFIRKSLAVAGKKGTVALLLRANYLLPKTRRALRVDFGLPDRYELERRPSFNGSGTDATDYAWHVWSPKRSGRWSVLSLNGKEKSSAS